MTDAAPSAPICDYCGLPLARRWWSRSAPADEPEYCCLGCQVAAQIAEERGPDGEARLTLARLGLAVFLTVNVTVFTMVLWTDDVYGPNGHALAAPLHDLFRYLGLIFSLPVLWLLGGPLARGAWQALRSGRPSTDLLLVQGVVAAYVYSAVSVFRGEGPVYFEVGCVVLVSVTLGRWLEATGRLRATAALDALARLLPERVTRLAEGAEADVPLDDVRAGDRLLIRAGQRIPADGVLTAGTASIDEQILSGESRPRIVEPGSVLSGGSLNLDGTLELCVTAGPREGTFQRLLDAVAEARDRKGHYHRLADVVAGWFLPLVALITIGVLAAHWAAFGLDRGLLAAMAVVLIACPCALGLATPMAVWAALGTAARRGVVFRHGEAVERLARVRAVGFDKTGTLTTGRPSLDRVIVAEGIDAAEVERVAAALASRSEHALARAILEARVESHDAAEDTAHGGAPLDVRTHPGRGLSAFVPELGATVWLGSPRLMHEQGLAWPARLREAVSTAEAEARPLACLGWDGAVRGVWLFGETLRDESAAAVAACQAAGLSTFVLTGDHAPGGRRLAERLGIEVLAELLPEEKVAALERVRRYRGPVAMVGDGINDAPALGAADVGIAMGCGADVSRQSADVCLVGNDLRLVPWAAELARRTVRTIRFNLFWAFAYNVVGIALAAAGMLNPIWAAIAMVASSVLVVAHSLRLTHDGATPPAAAANPSLAGEAPDGESRPAATDPDATAPPRVREEALVG